MRFSVFSALIAVAACGARAVERQAAVIVADAQSLSATLPKSRIEVLARYDGAQPTSVAVTLALPDKQFIVAFASVDVDDIRLDSVTVLGQPGLRQKTAADDALISELHSSLAAVDRTTPLGEALMSSVELVLDRVPEDEPIDTIAVGSGATASHSYTAICQFRGDKLTATFDSNKGKTFKVRATVGDPAQGCLGRCGSGCAVPARRARDYTQECFNHALCQKHFGTSLGNCANEWSAEQYGYLNGKSCLLDVVGTWAVTFSWAGYPPQNGNLILSADHTFTTAGATGLWSLVGSKLKLTVKAGCEPIYAGVVSANNLTYSGAMKCAALQGTFKATFTTTATGGANIAARRSAFAEPPVGAMLAGP